MHRFLTALALFALPLIAAPARADVFMFGMPSGNVDCSVGLEHGFSDIICTIYNRSGKPAAPDTRGCGKTWGHVFSMNDTGAVTLLCTDRIRSPGKLPASQIMPYGVSNNFGGITCHSLESGLECRNRSGHGFKLSRKIQLLY